MAVIDNILSLAFQRFSDSLLSNQFFPKTVFSKFP